MKLLDRLFGRISREHALEMGMTHSASYHGLAVWIGRGGDLLSPVIYAQCDVMEWLLPVIAAVEMFFQHAAGVPHDQRGPHFVNKEPINPPTGADRAR